MPLSVDLIYELERSMKYRATLVNGKIEKGDVATVTVQYTADSIVIIALYHDGGEDGYTLSRHSVYGNEITDFWCEKFHLTAERK